MIRLTESDVPPNYPVSLVNTSIGEKKEDTRVLRKSNSRFTQQFFMPDLPKKHRVTKLSKKDVYEKKDNAHALTKANSRFHPRFSKTGELPKHYPVAHFRDDCFEKRQNNPARKRMNSRLNQRIRSFGTTLFGGLDEETVQTSQTSVFDELDGKELDKAFDDALERAFEHETFPDFSLFNPTDDDDEENHDDYAKEYTEEYSRTGSLSTISNVSEHYCRGCSSDTYGQAKRGTSKTSKKKDNREEDDSFISALSFVIDDCCIALVDDCTEDARIKKNRKKKNVDFFRSDDHSEDPLEGYSIGYENSAMGSRQEISLL
jgi:hypothetical protein